MSGPFGVQPTLIPLQLVLSEGSGLLPGQQVHAVVQGSSEGLFVQVGGVRIPLGALPQLLAGQTVLLELVRRPQGTQLRVTPQSRVPVDTPTTTGGGARAEATVARSEGTRLPPQSETTGRVSPSHSETIGRTTPSQGATTGRITPQPQQPGAGLTRAPAGAVSEALGGSQSAEAVSVESLRALIASVLELLDARVPTEIARPLVPAHLPLTQTAVRSLLTVLLVRSTLGDDLTLIRTLVSQAATAGAAPAGPAEATLAALEQVLASDVSGLGELVRRLVSRAGHSVEGRLAHALETGEIDDLLEFVARDLRVQLSRLREDGLLTRFLEERGQLRGFQSAIDRVLERLAGAQVQNLRGGQQAYHFVELPMASDGPITRAQVHFFGEGRGKGRRFDGQDATVVLDVSTTRLGDLWVRLAIAGGRCACGFRTTSEEAARAIEAAAPELVQSLADAGYPGAEVHVAGWDGDRIRETVNLMSRFTGLNVSA